MTRLERMTVFCENLATTLGFYRELIVYDPDGVLVSILQIDPLPAEELR